ncbi:MAG: PKD domain-containing protein, partial [Ferruginibacter sp.]
NYIWSFSDGKFDSTINPLHIFAPKASAYTIQLVASSNFGCKDSAVKANLITAKLPPASDFFISPFPVITVPSYTFNFNNLTLSSINYKYLWSLGDGSFASTRDVTHKYADTGNYNIRLIVLDTVTNCPDTTIKIARIDGFPGYLYVPNAICPKCIQSGLRTFMPKGAGLKEYRLQIYTTWNELVFESSALDSKGTPTRAWDGTWQRKPQKTNVQQDVYVWRIDAKFLNGSEWLGMIYPGDSKYKKTGTITVVR